MSTVICATKTASFLFKAVEQRSCGGKVLATLKAYLSRYAGSDIDGLRDYNDRTTTWTESQCSAFDNPRAAFEKLPSVHFSCGHRLSSLTVVCATNRVSFSAEGG
jgi:hypothetical protein